jgi:hypothetical protein
MADEADGKLPVAQPAAEAPERSLTDAKKPEDLVGFAQDEDHRKRLAELSSVVKIPSDLSKVSVARARELSEAGLVDDRDLPGKMYKRKADGFVVRIPDYTFEAYSPELKDEWEEVRLTSDAP